jgi:hypothetical protein
LTRQAVFSKDIPTGGFAGGACIKATGYNIKQGFSGALGASVFNIDWSSGTAKLWIDTTNVGTITLTSDYRIKQDVETQTEAGLSRNHGYRILLGLSPS